MRDDILISVKALIHQPPEYNPPVLPTQAPAPLPDPAMNSGGNSNAEILIFIQQLQQQMTTLGNFPPPNPSGPPQNRVRHKRANVSK